jgi:hypothetical protein
MLDAGLPQPLYNPDIKRLQASLLPQCATGLLLCKRAGGGRVYVGVHRQNPSRAARRGASRNGYALQRTDACGHHLRERNGHVGRIRGADLILACIGPAMEIYSRYRRVEDAKGREIPLGGEGQRGEASARRDIAGSSERIR